jgi:hypothetical protein
MDEPIRPKKRHEGSCDHCGSLDVVDKKSGRYCRDCGAVTKDGEVLKSGMVELHYSLEVLTRDRRALWRETLDVLFEAQCDIAAGMKIAPGSSFTKWLISHQRPDGLIEKPEIYETLQKIVCKMANHLDLIVEEHNRARILSLLKAMEKGRLLKLSFDKR